MADSPTDAAPAQSPSPRSVKPLPPQCCWRALALLMQLEPPMEVKIRLCEALRGSAWSGLIVPLPPKYLVRGGALGLLQDHVAQHPEIQKLRFGHRWGSRLRRGEAWNTADLYYRSCKHGQLRVAQWLRQEFGLSEEEMNMAGERSWRGVHRLRLPAFSAACRAGQLPVARWLASVTPLCFLFAQKSEREVFALACISPSLSLAQWFYATFAEPRALRESDSRRWVSELSSIFWEACQHGRLKIARWLRALIVQRGRPHRPLDVAPNYATPPCYSCLACLVNGHLDMAKWLAKTLRLTRADVVARGNGALAWACNGGHLECVQWLCEAFALAKADLLEAFHHDQPCFVNRDLARWLISTFALSRAEWLTNGRLSFRTLCAGGNTAAAREVLDELHLAREGVGQDVGIFFLTCCFGRLETAQWLHETFALTKAEVLAVVVAYHLPEHDCVYGSAEVARWLCATFAFSAADVKACDYKAFISACYLGRLDVAQWLYANYPPSEAQAHEAYLAALQSDRDEVVDWLREKGAA